MKSIVLAISAVCLSSFTINASAAEINVAVAANFSAPMKEIGVIYEKESGNKLLVSYGGSGTFYTQIKNGAPYQIFFSADQNTPKKLAEESFGIKDTVHTYAVGKLILWSARPDFVQNNKDFLLSKKIRRIAIADPRLAPYGLAAYQTLTKWDILDAVKSKLVTGDNVGKAFQYAKTENAQVGFIALSQVQKEGKLISGSGWVIPSDLYEPIKQDYIVLNSGKNNKTVDDFLKFMNNSQKVKAIIQSYGYSLEK